MPYGHGDMHESSPQDAYARLSRVLNDRRFRKNLANARNNWLGANVDKVVSGILKAFVTAALRLPAAAPRA